MSSNPLKTQEIARRGVGHGARLDSAVGRPGVPGKPPFQPLAPRDGAFRLNATAIGALSDATRDTLGRRLATLTEQPLDTFVSSLEKKLESMRKSLDELYAPPVQRNLKRYGDTLVMVSTTVPSTWTTEVTGLGGGQVPVPPPLPGSIPMTRGEVALPAQADLLIVKQQLIGYEAADVAHIENVLKGERKDREHRRRGETEQLTFRETEITTTEERELESTDRFEMTRETSDDDQGGRRAQGGPHRLRQVRSDRRVLGQRRGARLALARRRRPRRPRRSPRRSPSAAPPRSPSGCCERTSLRVTNEVIEKNDHELDNVRRRPATSPACTSG